MSGLLKVVPNVATSPTSKIGRQQDPHRSTRGSRGLARSGDDGVELILDELSGDCGRPADANGIEATLSFTAPALLDLGGGLELDAVGENSGDGCAIILGKLQELIQEVLGLGRHRGIIALPDPRLSGRGSLADSEGGGEETLEELGVDRERWKESC